jgi:hypothetical protein
MNTNGGVRDAEWWRELASILNQPNDYVVFSIDGLEDTNHIYRRDVNWKTLINNAQSFIDAGGSAHWDMLIYRHNQHQVGDAEELARRMGFTWFRSKITRRILTPGLEYPLAWQPSGGANKGKIFCHALDEKSIYIDAQGRMSPCCWLGSRQKDFIQDISVVQKTWDTDNPHPVCKAACTLSGGSTNFQNQWQKEIQLC